MKKKTSIYIDVFLKNIDVEKYRCFPNIAQHYSLVSCNSRSRILLNTLGVQPALSYLVKGILESLFWPYLRLNFWDHFCDCISDVILWPNFVTIFCDTFYKRIDTGKSIFHSKKISGAGSASKERYFKT